MIILRIIEFYGFILINFQMILSTASNVYQTGTHSPCPPNGCDYSIKGSLYFTFKFNETFVNTPKPIGYIVSYTNMDSQGSYLLIDSVTANLTGMSYDFIVYHPQYSPVFFTIGWIATTLNNFQLISSGYIYNNNINTLKYPKPTSQ